MSCALCVVAIGLVNTLLMSRRNQKSQNTPSASTVNGYSSKAEIRTANFELHAQYRMHIRSPLIIWLFSSPTLCRSYFFPPMSAPMLLEKASITLPPAIFCQLAGIGEKHQQQFQASAAPLWASNLFRTLNVSDGYGWVFCGVWKLKFKPAL